MIQTMEVNLKLKLNYDIIMLRAATYLILMMVLIKNRLNR